MRWLLLVVALMVSAQAHAQPPQFDCLQMDDESREKIRVIVLDALDQALKDHIAHLFQVWMRDEGNPAQRRASHGTRLGVGAYIRARDRVLKMEWSCPPSKN